MHYLVMDLEWNNAYARKKKGFFNEIIEIGAVLLDEELNVIDTFSRIIRSQVGKRLRSSVKELTNITNDDIRSGELFTKTVSDFKKWIGADDTVVMTWGDGDIRVMYENYFYLNGIKGIPFLKKYCDLQACFHRATSTGGAAQVGLHTAAEHFELNPDEFSLHRALGDSLLTAEVLKKLYNPELIKEYTRECNAEFYQRMFFKPKVIADINNPGVDKSMLCHTCDKCARKCRNLNEWKFQNQYFKNLCRCDKCGTVYSVGVRFRRYFDRIDVRKVVEIYDPKKQKNSAAKESKDKKGGKTK